ncbi:DUF4231 domain-containing protein [Conexibacter stalactiti]|uniref:DUF4231 domain-containing protein n=1 Tax=Conexibacter stalactiti TaxID=1940611 RepID=A0ABU4HHZ5_9ACTN|nr:DUF4231 domain-containing protein [Conexibacter stalactiti]MDW5592928.1 DUF4231 domain-containing protein [Conexibacter stalactiti]MEC5033569.1 DUF4231 domain-containing protein [Conexibacter stalactiti]
MGDATAVEAVPEVVTSGGGQARGDAAAWARLEEQIAWYDRKSGHSQRCFKALKVLQIVIAAAIPVVAGASGDAWRWLVAIGGAAIVVLEGFQQLFQYQQNWATYRSTCERLKHEKFLCAAGAGPYAGAPRPGAMLAERVEGLVSQEHAAWASTQRQQQEETTR